MDLTSPDWEVEVDGYLINMSASSASEFNVANGTQPRTCNFRRSEFQLTSNAQQPRRRNLRRRLQNNEKICRSNAIYGAGGRSKDVNCMKWETITAYIVVSRLRRAGANQEGRQVENDRSLRFYEASSVRDPRQSFLLTCLRRPQAKDHGMGAESMAMTFFQFAKALRLKAEHEEYRICRIPRRACPCDRFCG